MYAIKNIASNLNSVFFHYYSYYCEVAKLFWFTVFPTINIFTIHLFLRADNSPSQEINCIEFT